jgi:hypothetical protein
MPNLHIPFHPGTGKPHANLTYSSPSKSWQNASHPGNSTPSFNDNPPANATISPAIQGVGNPPEILAISFGFHAGVFPPFRSNTFCLAPLQPLFVLSFIIKMAISKIFSKL